MSKKLSYEEVKAYIEGEEGNGCKLISKEYLGYNRILTIRCKCGKKFKVTLKRFKEENYKTCWNCGTDYRDSKEYRNFIKEVKDRDNNICQCCKEEGRVVHHLNGYNWDYFNRSNINNGILLCDDCHKKFHSIFGYGYNTKEQYIYFRIYRLFEREITNDNVKNYFNYKNEEKRKEIIKQLNKVICIYPDGKKIIKDNIYEMAKYLKVESFIIENLITSGSPYRVTNKTNYNTANKLAIKGVRILQYEKYLNELYFNKIN